MNARKDQNLEAKRQEVLPDSLNQALEAFAIAGPNKKVLIDQTMARLSFKQALLSLTTPVETIGSVIHSVSDSEIDTQFAETPDGVDGQYAILGRLVAVGVGSDRSTLTREQRDILLHITRQFIKRHEAAHNVGKERVGEMLLEQFVSRAILMRETDAHNFEKLRFRDDLKQATKYYLLPERDDLAVYCMKNKILIEAGIKKTVSASLLSFVSHGLRRKKAKGGPETPAQTSLDDLLDNPDNSGANDTKNDS